MLTRIKDPVDGKVMLHRELKRLIDAVKAHPPELLSCEIDRVYDRDGEKIYCFRVTLYPLPAKKGRK